MFFRNKTRDEEKLKDLLKDSWKVESGEEKKAFLQRLKVVLPKDHPGLLCLPGKSGNGKNADGRKVESAWKRRNLVSFVATWVFLFALVGLTYLGIKALLYVPDIDNNVPVRAGTGGSESQPNGMNIEKEVIPKYRYRFKGFELSGMVKMSLAELSEELMRIMPKGSKVNITGMNEAESYMEEKSSVIYSVVVYDLDGTWDSRPASGDDDRPHIE